MVGWKVGEGGPRPGDGKKLKKHITPNLHHRNTFSKRIIFRWILPLANLLSGA